MRLAYDRAVLAAGVAAILAGCSAPPATSNATLPASAPIAALPDAADRTLAAPITHGLQMVGSSTGPVLYVCASAPSVIR